MFAHSYQVGLVAQGCYPAVVHQLWGLGVYRPGFWCSVQGLASREVQGALVLCQSVTCVPSAVAVPYQTMGVVAQAASVLSWVVLFADLTFF